MDYEHEILECQKSIIYFLSNNCKLQHPSAGILPFVPFKYQQRALHDFQTHKYNIVRKCRQCFRGDSTIWGPDGPKYIKDVKVGDLVYSLNQLTGLLEIVPVLDTYDNGIAEVVEVRTKTGHRSYPTDCHEFLTSDGFVKAGVLNSDDIVIEVNDLERFGYSEDPTDDEIKILAYLITDGSAGRWITFNNSCWSYLLEYQRCWRRVFNNRLRIRKHKSQFKEDSDINYRLQSGLKIAKEWAAEYDILGRTYGNKIIPKQVFSWSNRAIALFLNRMFAADGWYSGGNCNEAGIGQEAQIILHQIKQLLTRFGINSKFYPPTEDSLAKLRIIGGRDFERFVDQIDIYKKEPRNPITKGFLRNRIKGQIKEVNNIDGEYRVYDLKVPPHDNYIVDGAVVHNCGISQISGAYALHQAMFFPYQTILIISKKEDDAKGFLKRNIGFLFDNLPEWMKDLWAPLKRNEHEIVFPNYSSIKSLTSSPNVLRSHASSLNIIDEAAFIPSMDQMWAAGWSCVTANTMLSTETGLVRIGSLVKNDDTWQDININVNYDTGQTKADKVYLSGHTPVRKITTELGIEITATPNHRIRIVNPNGEYAWQYVSTVKQGQYAVIRLGERPEKLQIQNELYIAGIILGRAKKVGDEIHTKFNSQLLTADFVAVCNEFLGEDGFVINKRQLRVSNEIIFDIIKKYNIDINSPIETRSISNEILALGKDLYYHIICGLIDAQSASGKRIGAIFDSHKLAREIQDILFDFGFPIAISETASDQWRLIVIDSEIGNEFCEHFYSTRSDLRLCAESGQNLNTDHPMLVHFFEQECEVLLREYPDDPYINKCGSYGRIRFNDIASMLDYVGDINSWLVSNNLFVDRIESVTESTADTFDIQVPGPHCYVSNSLVSHNTLQHGGRVIVVSTLNGMGDWYHRTIKAAETKENDFNLIEINWYDMDWVIEYQDKFTKEPCRIAPCDEIRPSNTAAEKETFGPYWSPWLDKQYRALAEEGETWKFDQEILARVVSSGKTVLPAVNLDRVEADVIAPTEKISGIRQYVHPITRKPISLDFNFEGDQGFWVWEKPVKKAKDFPNGLSYVMGVDTATGRGNDYNSIEIFCMETAEQVAELNMRCIPKLLAAYIDMIGRWYNNACVSVERNNGGDGVIDELRLEYSYPNLWRNIKISEKINTKPIVEPYGFYTTEISKIRLNKLLVDLIGAEGGVKVYSSRLFEQLCTYINRRDKSGRPTGKTGAENSYGCHDDLVMSTSIGLLAMVNNPDPEKSKMLPFKTEIDFNIGAEQPDQKIVDYDQNLVCPVSINPGVEPLDDSNTLGEFSRSLVFPPTEAPPAVVKRKKDPFGEFVRQKWQ